MTDHSGEPPEAQARSSRWTVALVAIGSAGLVVSLAADFTAVLGRHLGFGFPGSIEIFQMAISVALSAAILLASLNDRHAAVDLFLGRASPLARTRLKLAANAALAFACGLLCAGSIWVATDLWATHEITELLSIPVQPFRLIWIAASAIATIHFGILTLRGIRA